MKYLALFAVLSSSAFAGSIDSDCTLNGKKLYGKVQVVTSFADFKVEEVQSFPDLKVEKKSSFADDCGEWEFVDSFPDFTIEYVTSFADFKIEFVNSFPGLP
ncbi:MAG: hypothetical protein VW546_09150 [Gammaproteobacteria bacterium]